MNNNIDNKCVKSYHINVEEVNSSMNLDNGINYEQPCEESILTVSEMATYMRISKPTAYALIKNKSFPSFRIGRKVLISKQCLDNWIKTQCQGGHNGY